MKTIVRMLLGLITIGLGIFNVVKLSKKDAGWRDIVIGMIVLASQLVILGYLKY